MTTLTKIPQPHVHTLVVSFYVQSSLQSLAQVFLKGNKTKVGTPILKGFPGQELYPILSVQIFMSTPYIRGKTDM